MTLALRQNNTILVLIIVILPAPNLQKLCIKYLNVHRQVVSAFEIALQIGRLCSITSLQTLSPQLKAIIFSSFAPASV
jgi:hypothetical protein